jgi:hypothetical protein
VEHVFREGVHSQSKTYARALWRVRCVRGQVRSTTPIELATSCAARALLVIPSRSWLASVVRFSRPSAASAGWLPSSTWGACEQPLAERANHTASPRR